MTSICGRGWGLGINIHTNVAPSYGYPESENPNLFYPDMEVCTSDEMKNWRIAINIWNKPVYKQPYGEDGRCIHCGAGDDIHHSFTCPTGLHPDSPSSKQPQCICGEINSRNCPVHQ